MSCNNLEAIPCPLCNSTNLINISDKGKFGLTCHVKICSNDGMMFLSPRWSAERYLHFYQKEYDNYYRKIDKEYSNANKFQKIHTICKRLDEYGLNNMEWRSALDIGAGMGWSMDYLKKHYPQFKDFFAIEASNNCLSRLNDSKIKVLSSNIDDKWGGAFDFIVMRHVLEHTMDPVSTLLHVQEQLTDIGILYISVPDMMNPKGSLYNHWYRSVHTYYFSESTLLKCALKSNLHPIVSSSENNEIYAFFQKKQSRHSNAQIVIERDDVTFRKQMKVLRWYNIFFLLKNVHTFPKKAASYLLPKKIKQAVRSWLSMHER